MPLMLRPNCTNIESEPLLRAILHQHPQAGCAPLSHRSTGALHQQPGGTGWADDETAAENIWRLSLRGWRERLWRDPLAPLNSQKARLGYPRDTDRRPP